MTSVFTDIEKLAADLWGAAGNLRTDSALTSGGISVQSTHFIGNEDGGPMKKAMFCRRAKNALATPAAFLAHV